MSKKHLLIGMVSLVAGTFVAFHATRLGDDDIIKRNVASTFVDHPDIDATLIDIMVEDGVVTLTGELPHHEAREMAISVAEQVDGVGRVVDRITIEIPLERESTTVENSEAPTPVTRRIPMKSFRISEDRHLEPIAPEIFGADVEQPTWILMSSEEFKSFELVKELELHRVIAEAIMEQNPSPKVAGFGKSLLVSIPVPTQASDPPPAFLHIVCQSNLIISIVRDEIVALEKLAAEYTEGMRFHSASLAAVLYQILDYIIDDDLALTHKTRDRVDALEDSVQEGSGELLMRDAGTIRRRLTRLAAAFEDQLYCVSTLQTLESEAFSINDLQHYFHDAISELNQASRAVSHQKVRLASIQQEYQLRQQDRTASQVRVLTIISTIFLPLTLVTGIYGMNFHNMPEYGWRYGYFGTLAAMALIAAGMLWGFKKAGWFK